MESMEGRSSRSVHGILGARQIFCCCCWSDSRFSSMAAMHEISWKLIVPGASCGSICTHSRLQSLHMPLLWSSWCLCPIIDACDACVKTCLALRLPAVAAKFSPPALFTRCPRSLPRTSLLRRCCSKCGRR
jgi:hypothetical protein